jgi:sialic acid synthase SpsE
VTIEIGGRTIGLGQPPFVIAEAGVHHANSLELAMRYITEARIAGADAVKFQTYTASRLAARWAPVYWDDGASERTQFDVFAERSLFGEAEYSKLFQHAADVGIILLSTPFDSTSAAMLAALDMPAFKTASADLTNHPLLQSIATHGKPVLMSTGAATLEEVRGAVEVVRNKSGALALLHCNLSYPTVLADANLNRLALLAAAFPDVVLGYSDHTLPEDSELACPLAVALGARLIEKHFTLNRFLPGDDHYHAVDPAGLARLVHSCRAAYDMTGEPLEITASETAARNFARRSVVAARDLPAGHLLTFDDVDFKRPGTGLPPSRVSEVLGRVLAQDLSADALVLPEDLV